MAAVILTLFLSSMLWYFTEESSLTSSSSSSNSSNGNVIKLRMIHAMYSEESPLYDASLSNADRLKRLITIDQARQHHLLRHHYKGEDSKLSSSSWAETPVESGAFLGLGQYLVLMSFGSPPQNLLLIADTGSDLIWLQCTATATTTTTSGDLQRQEEKSSSTQSPQLCKHCSTRWVFHSRKSSTLQPVPCSAAQCYLVPAPRGRNPPCSAVQPAPCAYTYDYADGSSTTGFLARDTATIRNSTSPAASVPDVAFGCGVRNQGSSIAGAGGVLGLGQGELSFVQQSGSQFSHTFSYCLHDLVSKSGNSFLFMGRPDTSPPPTLSYGYTPLITNPLAPTFYYVSVQAVRVANRQLGVPSTEWSIDVLGNGGTVIDSGSTLSFLRLGVYLHLLTAFTSAVHLPRIAGSSELYQGLELCYNASSSDVFPRVTVDFAGGLSLELPTSNYVVDVADGVKCLAVRPTLSPFAFNVIGNLMQQGYHVEFDRGNSRIGFARTECVS